MPIPHAPPTPPAELLRRLIAGDRTAAAEVLFAAPAAENPALLVVAAVVSGEAGQLGRASAWARTARDRQLVALAAAHLRGDADLFDVLVREHLAAYPDHVLAAWLAAEHSLRPGSTTARPGPFTDITRDPRSRR